MAANDLAIYPVSSGNHLHLTALPACSLANQDFAGLGGCSLTRGELSDKDEPHVRDGPFGVCGVGCPFRPKP